MGGDEEEGGAEVCAGCRDDIAAAAGVVAYPATPVEGAVATGGWFRILRKRRRTPGG